MKHVPCRSCGAMMSWVPMAASGKKNPLDIQPSPQGTVSVGPDDVACVLTGAALEAARKAGTGLYLSHFATCPNSRQHRKPK